MCIRDRSFSTTMTGISIVTLAGIVVNNNIVLIDTFNRLKEDSPQIEQSLHIINACKQRLRPIVLTSLTTIFGLLPLAMGVSLDLISRDIVVGSRIVDWWSNLAVSIVFGLGFSTFVTLILTPAVLALPYALMNEYKKKFNHKVTILNKNEFQNKYQEYRTQGIIVFFDYTVLSHVPDSVNQNDNECHVILDSIKDPQNLGQIIRTSECAGIDGIILPERRSVSITSSVLQVSQGSFCNINIIKSKNLFGYTCEINK